jgi:hypothetical protein
MPLATSASPTRLFNGAPRYVIALSDCIILTPTGFSLHTCMSV